MPKIRPNPQLKQIVLEETNDGRDVVRFLKSTFKEVEDAPRIFGLRHKDYARSHKIAAARILARIGLEEGKRYLRRNYVQTPFKRVNPEDEDLPRKEMAASTSELYRLVKKETNDGRDIIIRFVGIMKGHYPEYKPHLRMAAAKELIRQIEFDYDEEPTRTESASASTNEPTLTEPASESASESADEALQSRSSTSDRHSRESGNPGERDVQDLDSADYGETLDSAADPIENPLTPEFIFENPEVSLAQIQRRMHIEDGSVHYRDYAERHASESESIYQSIIRRASNRPDMESAKLEADELIGQFDRFMAERDPGYQPIAVPDELISRSLTRRMDESQSRVFDPADYYDLDRDYFYYCMCRVCEQCDELDYFIEFMRELEEEYEDP